jgi:ribosomal protein S18 acetylase RimI-like enzyme
VIQRLDLGDEATAASVLALQRAAYAVESELIGSDAIPGLHESLEDLRDSPEEFAGVVDDGELVAALAYEVTLEVLDISRLVVAPSAFRRGLGERLVRWVLDAVPRPITIVSTGSRNAPAIALYAKLGFTEVGRAEPVPGLPVTRFELRR